MSKRDLSLYVDDILDSAKAIVWDLTKQELSVLISNINNIDTKKGK